MHINGIIIGILSFIIIGVFHPIVIKCEYHFSSKIWPIFLVIGILFAIASLFVSQVIISSLLSVIGFTALWCIGELKEQKERVDKGWFPKNPNRKD